MARPSQATERSVFPCLVSHRHRFLCVLIAKNASTTLRTVFGRPEYGVTEFPSRAIGADLWREYFCFTMLRDPVSRLLSAYQEISMRMEVGEEDAGRFAFASMPEGPERLAAFLDRVEVGSWDDHVRPQSRFVDGLPVDLWGRVETLDADVARVLETLGLAEAPPLPILRSRLERAARHGYDRHLLHPRDLDAPTLARIWAIYREDVELLEKVRPSPPLLGG